VMVPQFKLTACPSEMLSLYSANLASPNWPLVVRLIFVKRPLPCSVLQYSPGSKRSLRWNAT